MWLKDKWTSASWNTRILAYVPLVVGYVTIITGVVIVVVAVVKLFV